MYSPPPILRDKRSVTIDMSIISVKKTLLIQICMFLENPRNNMAFPCCNTPWFDVSNRIMLRLGEIWVMVIIMHLLLFSR